MSEEILKALTQLFAIFSKQDYGTSSHEREFVERFFMEELDQDSVDEYIQLYDQLSGFGTEKAEKKRTSVSDSVRTLSICRKINKTLTQKQKVIVLIKIMELVTADDEITPTEIEILKTVAEVFNFSQDEYQLIEDFVFHGVKALPDFDSANMLIVSGSLEKNETKTRKIQANLNGSVFFLKVPSVNLYFLRYTGKDELILNGFVIRQNRVYLFSNGSTVKFPSGEVIYFSELIAHFNDNISENKLSFEALDIRYEFPGGKLGLRDINIRENAGKLIGIMGASGAGKTTLLNVLAGLSAPSTGSVKINEIDIYSQKKEIEGIIGYVSQDDLLIEDLTVYENLYYNAKLCFGNLNREEIRERVMHVLANLGLDQHADLKVGSVLDKKISGGQRKRLNIALELIREPAVLFVDEPTSGLSSRDSENVVDLLKELSLKGKLVFVVIHQPSSDIYKMFDKMYILDTGGYPVYYGDPVEAVAYFKEASHQVDKNRGICTQCGSVNPEQIFNILDAKVVDEYGQLTPKRKMTPEQWYDHFKNGFLPQQIKKISGKPANLLKIPNRLRQLFTFITRDFKSKISNRQYIAINLLEAPVLAIILAWVSKFSNSVNGEYVFRYNDNLPIFFMMSIVVALFLGLTVSAEEILKDRKILKRESFLNLSWNSYLVSKLMILWSLSAIQSLQFVLISVYLLEIKGMFFDLWLIMFTVAAFANMLGLIISSAFNSPVTVYILIPIILIPQMILSGMMIPFDKLNKSVASEVQVPVMADIITSRWAMEALAVRQYNNNDYEGPYFELNMLISDADYKSVYLANELKKKTSWLQDHLDKMDDTQLRQEITDNLNILKNEINKEYTTVVGERPDWLDLLTPEQLSDEVIAEIEVFIDALTDYYQEVYNNTINKKEQLINFLQSRDEASYDFNDFKDRYFNQRLSDIVRKVNEEDRIIEWNGELIKNYDPVYNSISYKQGILNYRAPFYSPYKSFLGRQFNTFWFNLAFIWFTTTFLYIVLYFKWLPGFLIWNERIVRRVKNHQLSKLLIK